MRLVFLNPHTFQFKKIPARLFNRKKNLFRYGYLLEENDDFDVALMANGSRTSFQKFFLRKIFQSKFGSLLEISFWLILNRMNPLRYRVYSTSSKLDPSQDVLFTFGVDISQLNLKQLEALKKYKGLILVHLTHYFKNPSGIAKVSRELHNVVFVSESDLSSNEFFQKYFPRNSRNITLPFSFDRRFLQETSNLHRINKCVAVGTVLTVNEPQYLDFFGNENRVLQPMRRRIFNESTRFPDVFVNIMRDPENLKVGSTQEKQASNLNETEIEKAYYSINLVEYFEEHTMFISPEESIGLPSSNFVDGMIAGCAYVGAELSFYESLGMQSGTHFISYRENDFADLLRTVKYYQNHLDELHKISIMGRDFAFSNFSPESIRNKLRADIEKYIC